MKKSKLLLTKNIGGIVAARREAGSGADWKENSRPRRNEAPLRGTAKSELNPIFWTVFMLPYFSFGLQLESDSSEHLNLVHN